jgi:Mlc titration factor MtfA (ptsG expression regulator)
MLFSWWKRRRRKRILAVPLPEAWRAVLDGVPHLEGLIDTERGRLDDSVRIFLAEKSLEGCAGLALTDAIRVTIAGLASLLTLGMPDYHFDQVHSVLVYPDAFAVPERVPIGPEVVLEDETEKLGEAHLRGPVILSWAEIREDLHEPWCGRNLVFHEFAHQLDALNGDLDGVPLLPRELQQPWEEVMAREYIRLTIASRRRRDTVLDPYGASEPAEFFAVATETFFDAPIVLRDEHPPLYELLARYYRQDPATRLERMTG